MPQFVPQPKIIGTAFEKREKAPTTLQNPTMTALMSARDRSGWVKVTIPKETAVFDVAYEPISLNAQSPFMPGETYTVPPEIADEINIAIKNFEDSIILQMSKRNKAAKGIPTPETMEREENLTEVTA